MKKHLLWKDAWQAIPRSLGRFIAIFLLMAVSAFALVGLKLTGPDMRQAATDFYRQTKLADLSITSNYGLSKADQRTIKHLAGVKTVEFGSRFTRIFCRALAVWAIKVWSWVVLQVDSK